MLDVSRAAGLDDFDDELAAASQLGGNVVIVAGTCQVTLQGVSIAALDADDVVF